MGWFRRGAKKSDSMADEALRRLDGRLLKYAVRLSSQLLPHDHDDDA